MKYKVGDLVRVKTWDELIDYGYNTDSDGDIIIGQDYFTSEMKPFCGKIFRIAKIDPFTNFYHLVDSDGKDNKFEFFDKILDPANLPEEKYSQSTERVENNAVEHPNHYTAGGIECIDAIRASLGNKEFADYCKGNVIKYLWRYRMKNGVEDLRKAQVYLTWMIEAEEANI